jgi:hypothetical protein
MEVTDISISNTYFNYQGFTKIKDNLAMRKATYKQEEITRREG